MDFICEEYSSRSLGRGERESIIEIKTMQGTVSIKEFIERMKELIKKNNDEELFEHLKHLMRIDPNKPSTVEGIELEACKFYSLGIYNNPVWPHYQECQDILRKKDQLTLMSLMGDEELDDEKEEVV